MSAEDELDDLTVQFDAMKNDRDYHRNACMTHLMRIRVLEAELADSRQWMAEMRATGAQHADRISALEADLADQVRVTEEHQRLRYQCETENTRLAAELAVAHTQCGHNQLTINALGERLGKKQDAQGELTQCDGPDSYE